MTKGFWTDDTKQENKIQAALAAKRQEIYVRLPCDTNRKLLSKTAPLYLNFGYKCHIQGQ